MPYFQPSRYHKTACYVRFTWTMLPTTFAISTILMYSHSYHNASPGELKKAQTDLQFLSQLFEQKRGIYWTIARQDNQQMIGSCGFETWHRTHARLELVYDLDPTYWGTGIMFDALQHIIQFAFTHMPVNRMVTADNTL